MERVFRGIYFKEPKKNLSTINVRGHQGTETITFTVSISTYQLIHGIKTRIAAIWGTESNEGNNDNWRFPYSSTGETFYPVAPQDKKKIKGINKIPQRPEITSNDDPQFYALITDTQEVISPLLGNTESKLTDMPMQFEGEEPGSFSGIDTIGKFEKWLQTEILKEKYKLDTEIKLLSKSNINLRKKIEILQKMVDALLELSKTKISTRIELPPDERNEKDRLTYQLQEIIFYTYYELQESNFQDDILNSFIRLKKQLDNSIFSTELQSTFSAIYKTMPFTAPILKPYPFSSKSKHKPETNPDTPLPIDYYDSKIPPGKTVLFGELEEGLTFDFYDRLSRNPYELSNIHHTYDDHGHSTTAAQIADYSRLDETIAKDEQDNIKDDGDDPYDRAKLAANNSGATPNSARWYSEYLSAYHGKPVTVKYILISKGDSHKKTYIFLGYKCDTE